VEERIEAYLASQPEAKQADLRRIHERTREEFPQSRLWFDDGTDVAGKVVANPTIGYGERTIRYADGASRAFYRVGLSGNTAGISVYVMGLSDKSALANTFGNSIGKATVTGYCIKFRRLSVIDADVLQAAIELGMTVDQDG